jgi:hypothetical protein
MGKNIFKLLAFAITLGFFSSACNEPLNEPKVDLATSQDNILSEKAVSEVFGLVNGLSGTVTAKAISECPTYTWASNLLTITFPETGCIGNDGYTRIGVIKAQFSNGFIGFWSVDDYVTITFENYSINGNDLTGTITATCTALEPNKVFRVTSENMELTFTDAKVLSWSTIVDYTMLAGGGTIGWSDDEWQIDGTNTGIARNGKSFTRQANALTTSTDCKYFISGHLIVTIDDTDTYDIEFKPTCGSVVITYKGIEFPMVLD